MKADGDEDIKSRWREGETANFEYHCERSHESSDAQLWYRSQQTVTVLSVTVPGYGRTITKRLDNGQPRVYRIRFADGFEGDCFEDELLTDAKYYTAEFEPPPVAERRLAS